MHTHLIFNLNSWDILDGDFEEISVGASTRKQLFPAELMDYQRGMMVAPAHSSLVLSLCAACQWYNGTTSSPH